jgi:hypothetical protein
LETHLHGAPASQITARTSPESSPVTLQLTPPPPPKDEAVVDGRACVCVPKKVKVFQLLNSNYPFYLLNHIMCIQPFATLRHTLLSLFNYEDNYELFFPLFASCCSCE